MAAPQIAVSLERWISLTFWLAALSPFQSAVQEPILDDCPQCGCLALCEVVKQTAIHVLCHVKERLLVTRCCETQKVLEPLNQAR